ncbi:MAG: cytochrome c oxidase accessory protein CcoG [Alphaproteobacteria bacterium]|nr:cytochrome c oxidase accessory protein CcoG [Alphaproteobacteria bacterium]
MAVIGQTTDGKRNWVYAARVSGRFQKLHRWSGRALMAILILVPWINIGGQPLARLDLPGRRLYALGQTFTPQDAIFIVLMLLFGAFSLFFFTSLFGRIWCGYACPQTVFLEEIIRPIERLFQGDRGRRMKLDQKKWSPEWIARKGGSYLAYLVVAVVVSMFLMGFFEDPRNLWTGSATTGAYGGVAFMAFFWFWDFAWFREQFCNYLCPYARFQGALTDDQSLNVMYRVQLAEPRGNKKERKQHPEQDYGLCIDCDKCVTVCPAGIDIRDGFQLECISCGRCVDACEGVANKMSLPEPLIAYTSLAAEEGRKKSHLRPRTVVYAGLLSAILAAFIGLMGSRHDLSVTLNRVPGTLYQVDEDGWVRNTFFLQVTNNHAGEAEGPAAVSVQVVGLDGAVIVAPPVSVAATESVKVPVAIRVPPSAANARTIPFQLELESDFDRVTVDGTFKSGAVEVN